MNDQNYYFKRLLILVVVVFLFIFVWDHQSCISKSMDEVLAPSVNSKKKTFIQRETEDLKSEGFGER